MFCTDECARKDNAAAVSHEHVANEPANAADVSSLKNLYPHIGFRTTTTKSYFIATKCIDNKTLRSAEYSTPEMAYLEMVCLLNARSSTYDEATGSVEWGALESQFKCRVEQWCASRYTSLSVVSQVSNMWSNDLHMNHSEALFKLADTLDGTSTRVQKWGPCQNVLREITTNLKNIAASIDESDSDGEDAAVTEFIWLGAPERSIPNFDAIKFAEEEKKFRTAAKVYLDKPSKVKEKKIQDVLRKLCPELSVFFADKSQREAIEYGINREKWAELATYSMLHGLRYRFPQGFDDFLSNDGDYAVYRNDPLSMPYEMLQKCVVEFLRELGVFFSDDHTPIWGAKKFSANATPDQVANTERMLAQRMMTAENIARLDTERIRREQLVSYTTSLMHLQQ